MNRHFGSSALHWVTDFVSTGRLTGYRIVRKHCSPGSVCGAESAVAEMGLSLGGVHHRHRYLCIAFLNGTLQCLRSGTRQSLIPSVAGLQISSVNWARVTHCNSVSSTAHAMWPLDSPCMDLGSSLAVGNKSIARLSG